MKIHYDAAKNARNIAARGLSFDRVADFDFETAKVREDVRRAYPESRSPGKGKARTRGVHGDAATAALEKGQAVHGGRCTTAHEKGQGGIPRVRCAYPGYENGARRTVVTIKVIVS